MSTMSKRILAMAVTLAVLATAVVGFMQRPKAVSAAAQDDNNGTHLCLQSNSNLCLDLLNDNFSPNTGIIWNSPQLGHGLGWNLASQGNVTANAPFSDTTFDTRYQGDPIFYIEKTTATGHNGCIGYNTSADNGFLDYLAWESCGADYTKWVWTNSDNFVNIHETNLGQSQGVNVPALMSSDVDPNGPSGCAEENGGQLLFDGPGNACNAQFPSTL